MNAYCQIERRRASSRTPRTSNAVPRGPTVSSCTSLKRIPAGLVVSIDGNEVHLANGRISVRANHAEQTIALLNANTCPPVSTVTRSPSRLSRIALGKSCPLDRKGLEGPPPMPSDRRNR